jgi:hypothetical protein
VGQELSAPISPARGLPAGDPFSPAALDVVLGVWTREVQETGAVVHLYMDDRSVGADTDEQLDQAIAVGAAVEAAIGIQENIGKRQRWRAGGGERVEHLGVTAVLEEEGAPPGELALRGGWEAVAARARRLWQLPGGQLARRIAAAVFVRPQWGWAPGLVPLPGEEMDRKLARAVIGGQCNWWCMGRWAADHLAITPTADVAIAAVSQAGRYAGRLAGEVWRTIRAAAAWLGVEVVEVGGGGHVVARYAGGDARVRGEWEAMAEAQAGRGVEEADRAAGRLVAGEEEGLHALRVAARAALLARVRRTRKDAAGVEAVDLAAQSHRAWASWRGRLTEPQQAWLRVWRGGAVKTATRGNWYSEEGRPCWWCGAALASARHLWAECGRFAAVRLEEELRWGIPAGWWAAQPPVTSKSGWVTLAAGDNVRQRAERQVAACVVGIAIVEAIVAHLGSAGEGGGL